MNSRCAACIHFRRRCSPGCIFAPHFPSTEPDKFEVLHRHFGARNVAKFLKKVEDNDERAQAIESMYFEALTRREDPVHGCSGLIAQLEQQISETEAQIARTHEAIAFYAHQADQGKQPQQSKASNSKSHKSEEPKAFSSKSHQSQQSKASSSKSP
ncbi:LOB domain-containing protein 24-like [Macadamia integrifolia]|uniref:LOB domain-containing protein 24-like n=1 Tax=Macadamia integrifolia TaxID=60698 RepID=UPI001C4F3D70|nr:LOB domain-containing protein 24-like [Macadamia integrifolia]